MSQTCTVCRHQKRQDIEIEIVRSVPYRDIARQYRLSKDAIARHAQVHLPAMLAKSEDAREVACADTIMGQAEGLRESALAILRKAEESEDFDTALKAIREARSCVELLARVAGELKDGPTVNILISAEWVQVQAVILGALIDHPAARLAIASALAQLEAPRADAA